MELAEKRKTMWLPDEDAPSCCLCQSEFTLINRRHHCRRCLKVFCNSCSSKKERLVLFGYPKDKTRVCNTCLPQAQRENEFEEVHVSLLQDGGIFHKHRKIGGPIPIFMALAQNRRELEWRSVELVQNRAQGIDKFLISELTGVTESEVSKTSFEIFAGQHSLKLDAGSHDHRSQWVMALKESMFFLLKDPREQIDQEMMKNLQIEPEVEFMDEREKRKSKRQSTINALREKYGVPHSDSLEYSDKRNST